MNYGSEIERERFSSALMATFEIYDKQFSPIVIKVWFATLKQYSIDEVCRALTAHIKDPDAGQFLPKPADVVRNIDGTKKAATADLVFIAQAAWLSIPKAINGVGGYRTPQFHDPITTACVSVMGWKNLCSMLETQVAWKEKEFVSLYEKFSTKPLDQLPNNIQGLEDVQKMKVGFKSTLAALEKLEIGSQS